MDATEQSDGRVIAGRYALADVLGAGGSGVVRRAQDLLLGVPVAVKSLRPGARSPEPRIRREIAALRLLRLPGVVTLRDEVREDDEIHLVMDIIEGAEFPGPDGEATWEYIAPLARSLLETLARVHAAGVVHRDLKPGNVLVDAAGRVTVVDFGLSRGPSLSGVALTMTGAFVGTPQYMAPEQLGSGSIDGRTDLYAVGVMLYEALAGTLPILGDNFGELARRKLSGSSVPLSQAAPHVPRTVARAIDLLLSVHPEDRPRTAIDALRKLYGDGAWTANDTPLPWLGSPEPLERALDAARNGRSLDIFGSKDSGRTRLLREVATTLSGEHRNVVWTTLGRSPFASLANILGDLADVTDLSRDEAFAILDQRLRDALSDGLVLLVDDPEEVDPWSSRALERCRNTGSILRIVAERTEGCVELGRLGPDDLQAVFTGPNRLLHLPEDASRELWRRTAGHPSRVRAEIAAWVRHGLAQQDGERIRVDRTSLSRLHGGLPLGAAAATDPAAPGVLKAEGLRVLLAWVSLAWPFSTDALIARVVDRPAWMLEPEIELLIDEHVLQRLEDGRLQPLILLDVLQVWPEDTRRAAHLALARALPENAAERVRHLVAAAETEEVIAAALSVGLALTDEGHTAEACATIEQGLDTARAMNAGRAYAELMNAYVSACLSEGTPAAADEALYELDRAPATTPDLETLRRLLIAILEQQRGDPARALSLLEECGALADPMLELWRQSHRVATAERLSVDVHERVLDEIGVAARETNNERMLANHKIWRTSLRARSLDPEEAVAVFLELDDASERATARMVGLLNAGGVLLGAARFDEAENAARRVVRLAQDCRHPLYEGYAESLLRDVRYRRRLWDGPDLELVDAAAAVGSPQLEALVAATECAFAWRADRIDVARALATRAATLWAAIGSRDGYRLGRVMEMVCGDAVDDDEVRSLIEEQEAAGPPASLVHLAGLITPLTGARRREIADRVRVTAATIPESLHGQTLAVISIAEALERAGPAE